MKIALPIAISAVAASILAAHTSRADVYIGLRIDAGPLTQVASGAHVANYTGPFDPFFNIQKIDVTDQGAVGDKLISSAIDILGTAARTLYVYVTSTGQTGNPTTAFLSSFASASIPPNGSVDLATYYDDGNGIFATTTALAAASYNAPGADEFTDQVAALSGPFSVTGVYTINWPGRTILPFTDSIRISTAIPEPSSLLLVLAFLGSLAALFCRKAIRG